MTDRYEKIRKALANGPTPGPWELREGRTDTVENAQGYPVCTVNYYPDERYGHGTRAAYIAACDPDTIRAMIAERDALAAEVERLAEALRKLEEREQRDEALLRQALEALLGQRGEPDWHTGKQRENAIAALRERLGVKA